MATASVLVLFGLVLLVAGGELLVRGATGIASLARVSTAIVGLTVVAAGTSMPELVVSLQAALRGSPGMAVGNVVGSNIFNIAAILGVAALLTPLRIEGNMVRLEYPVMALAAIQLLLLVRDGTLDRLEGGFLLVCLLAFTAYSVVAARRAATEMEKTQFLETFARVEQPSGTFRSWLLQTVLVLVGIGILIAGASSLVHGATDLARMFGIPETTIGLTIVAAGTSLPELAASSVAAFRGKADIAVANVVGSNIFNALGIAGVTALVHPLAVPPTIVARDALWMVGVSVALFPIMRSGMTITRVEGVLLLTTFGAYLTLLLL